MTAYIPSITTILCAIFFAYIGHSMWVMSQLFKSMECSSSPCYTYLLDDNPKFQLALFTSVTAKPIASEVTKIYNSKNFHYRKEFEKEFQIDVPLKTRRNGTLFLQVVFALEGEPLEWRTLKRNGPTIVHTASLTDYMVPEAESFNLLGENVPLEVKTKTNSKEILPKEKPSTHILSNVYVNLLTDSFSLSNEDVPAELARFIHINRNYQILPILKNDFFNTRLKDLVRVTKNTTEANFNFHYKPIGLGKLRLMCMIEHSMQAMQKIGFSKKDVDEVKGIFSDTNVYLLCGTVVVASIHMLFDFLSFKHDVSFWRKKKSYEGLSRRTTVWRAFSQSIIFLYLMDERTSSLVLIPAGIAALIEFWKCKKILKLEIGLFGVRKKQETEVQEQLKASEEKTEEFDKQGMRYLSYLLYPLCVCGAIYSLIYQPHRSWYSWTLKSLVNGVYTFGFLFMLPQLFVNYKLKSVAALPWRAFMYKAFNTFIDDFFAFVITMPTAHRVACLRDDVVFLIYLYQRWLYPVDNNRLDLGLSIEETTSETDIKENNEKAIKKDNAEKKKTK